jgi:hypothetical protein
MLVVYMQQDATFKKNVGLTISYLEICVYTIKLYNYLRDRSSSLCFFALFNIEHNGSFRVSRVRGSVAYNSGFWNSGHSNILFRFPPIHV